MSLKCSLRMQEQDNSKHRVLSFLSYEAIQKTTGLSDRIGC